MRCQGLCTPRSRRAVCWSEIWGEEIADRPEGGRKWESGCSRQSVQDRAHRAYSVRPRGLGATSREARRCGVGFWFQQLSSRYVRVGRGRRGLVLGDGRAIREARGCPGGGWHTYLHGLNEGKRLPHHPRAADRMVATRDIKMIVLPRPASKRPRAPLSCRWMCLRCGQVVSTSPNEVAEAMEPHFTDKLRFGCTRVDSRRPNISIAFFDHGLDDALFHCQGQLRHAQRQLSDQSRVALTLNAQVERLTEQLGEANGLAREVGELRATYFGSPIATWHSRTPSCSAAPARPRSRTAPAAPPRYARRSARGHPWKARLRSSWAGTQK